jgi:iron(III) transport system substrate-binding protein
MLRHFRNHRSLAYVTLIGALLLAALAVSTAPPAQAQAGEERLVVYSGRSEGLMGPIFARFTEETGVQLDIRYGSTSELAATILEEGANSPADVYVSQDAGALGAVAAENRLRTLPGDVLERVAPQFRSAAGQWVGLSGRARVLTYNADELTPDQLPASILDLTGEQWRGIVGWAPENASFQAHVTAMRLLLGEEATRAWLEGMVANEARAYPSNDAVMQGIINGEISAGLVNHYYVFEFQQQVPDFPFALHYFPPDDAGALVNVAGAGILDTSEQPGLAQRLILYLLGVEAQTYFAESTGEYPLAAGVPADPILRPLDEIGGAAVDLNDLADLRGTLDLLRETGALP